MTVAPQHTDVPAPGPPRRRRRVLLATAVVLAIGAASTAAVGALHDRSAGKPPPRPTAATASVVRADLAERTEEDGTLGYAGSHTVTASARGVCTWLPQTGRTIRRGHPVYAVDGHGTPLFYGAAPLWRTLHYGMADGSDVTVLERNLVKLGYGSGLAVDGHFSTATRAAVKEWQKDLGVTGSGTVAPGDVVVQPGALRVTSVTAVLGDPVHGRVLTASGTARQVTVDLPVVDQDLAKPGATVRIKLPGGGTTEGRVSSVGTVATSGSGADSSGGGHQTGEGTETAAIPVRISLDRPQDAGRLDGAPVTVGFTSTLHKNVLAVPVEALLAGADGGYAVRVVGPSGTSRRVPVRLGVFADGKVEVSGHLAEGTKVEVPRI